MRLTPLEVQQKQFSARLRGVDGHEVRQFLERCAGDMEDLVRETIALKEEVRARDNLLAEHREHERALQETLVSARRLADEMKDQARKEAEIIVAEAELQAERVVHDAHTRRATLLEELAELRRQRVVLETELRATLEGHLRLLETFAEPPAEKVSLLHRKDSA